MKYIELESERLIFRKFRYSDVTDIRTWLGNPENMQYRFNEPWSDDEISGYLNYAIKYAESENCVSFRYAIVLKSQNKIIGSCELDYTDQDPSEIAWDIHRDYWCKGYGTEVGKTLLKFGFETLKLRRIIATCNTLNIGSWRIMEKIGMRREGCFIRCCQGNSILNHQWCDKFQYAVLREEYLQHNF